MGEVEIKGKGRSVCEKGIQAMPHIQALANELGLVIEYTDLGSDNCKVVLKEVRR